MDVRRQALAIYRESLPILLVSLAGGIFAGIVLGSAPMREQLARHPGLLLALPAFLATRGNVYGALGARIASGLHQGLLDPSFTRDRRLGNAIAAAVLSGLALSLWIAFLAWLVLAVQAGRQPAPLLELGAVLLLAAALTASVMILGLLGIVFASYRRGMDPDNLVGPLVTTLGDVFGVAFLFAAAVIVEVVA